MMDSNSMSPRHPQGPVSEWLEYFPDIVDDGPFLLCCEELPILAILWILEPLSGEVT
jgi:hypothetical protein